MELLYELQSYSSTNYGSVNVRMRFSASEVEAFNIPHRRCCRRRRQRARSHARMRSYCLPPRLASKTAPETRGARHADSESVFLGRRFSSVHGVGRHARQCVRRVSPSILSPVGGGRQRSRGAGALIHRGSFPKSPHLPPVSRSTL